MQRNPLARYVPPLLIVATCAGCFEEREETGRLAGDMTEPYGPDIEVAPTSVDFGAVMVGETSTAELSVCNQGDEGLDVQEVALANGAPFSLGDLESDVVPPQECVTLAVVFAPESIDAFTDTLTITSDDADEPATEIPLEGLGVGED